MKFLSLVKKYLGKLRNWREIVSSYRRVLILAKKPTLQEFERAAKVCAIGTTIIGLIGFTFYVITVILGV